MKFTVPLLLISILLSGCQGESGNCERHAFVLLIGGTLPYDNFTVQDDQIDLKCCYEVVYDTTNIKGDSRVIKITWLSDSAVYVQTSVKENNKFRTTGNIGEHKSELFSEKNLAKEVIHTIYLKAWHDT